MSPASSHSHGVAIQQWQDFSTQPPSHMAPPVPHRWSQPLPMHQQFPNDAGSLYRLYSQASTPLRVDDRPQSGSREQGRQHQQRQHSRVARRGSHQSLSSATGQGTEETFLLGGGSRGETQQTPTPPRKKSRQQGAPQRLPNSTAFPAPLPLFPAARGKASETTSQDASVAITTGSANTEEMRSLSPATSSVGEAAGVSGVLQCTQDHAAPARRSNLSPCLYFLRTGECKFGDLCKYAHPDSLKPMFTAAGLPIRPGQSWCPFHESYKWCGFGKCCKFNHREGTARPATGSCNAEGSEECIRGTSTCQAAEPLIPEFKDLIIAESIETPPPPSCNPPCTASANCLPILDNKVH